MEKTFYITTPIYYVNAEPHLGHAYTTIVADVITRYHRLEGYETYFVTGTDEHGDKVLEAAKGAGMEPKQYVDMISGKFRELWPRLRISNDYFIRTTDPKHIKVVQYILQKVYEKGDIYYGQYQGYYCKGCERFYLERELADGVCPDHKVKPEFRQEENYFFRMSRYQDWLVEHIEKHPEFIRPERYRNEVLSFLREPLEDLCISRPKSRLPWGIELPFDRNYVTYVWFDALINYISALDYPDGDLYRKFWPSAQHLIAKDILKPHGIYWPTMLKAAGIAPYQHLNVHGYWNVEESKMSKSLGNIVRPLDLIDKYGLDSFRYFLMREMVFGLDSSFSEEASLQRYNADLANDLGNLFQRIMTMVDRYCSGKVPSAGETLPIDRELMAEASRVVLSYKEEMSGFSFHRALALVWELIGAVNRYVVSTEPWSLSGKVDSRPRLETVLYNCLEALRIITVLLHPFMPDTAGKMARQLGMTRAFEKGVLETLSAWGRLEAGTRITKGEGLFPRVQKASRATSQTIDLKRFNELDLRAGVILSAEKVEGSRKLMKLEVDVGEKRQVVAALADHYEPHTLKGKSIVLVANLKPATIMGIESQGMLLAAEGDGSLALVTLDGSIKPGTRVR